MVILVSGAWCMGTQIRSALLETWTRFSDKVINVTLYLHSIG